MPPWNTVCLTSGQDFRAIAKLIRDHADDGGLDVAHSDFHSRFSDASVVFRAKKHQAAENALTLALTACTVWSKGSSSISWSAILADIKVNFPTGWVAHMRCSHARPQGRAAEVSRCPDNLASAATDAAWALCLQPSVTTRDDFIEKWAPLDLKRRLRSLDYPSDADEPSVSGKYTVFRFLPSPFAILTSAIGS